MSKKGREIEQELLEIGAVESISISGRSLGKSRLKSLMEDARSPMGDHEVTRKEEGDGLCFDCVDCDWKAVFTTDDVPPEQCRLMEGYVIGDALETICGNSSSNADPQFGLNPTISEFAATLIDE